MIKTSLFRTSFAAAALLMTTAVSAQSTTIPGSPSNILPVLLNGSQPSPVTLAPSGFIGGGFTGPTVSIPAKTYTFNSPATSSANASASASAHTSPIRLGTFRPVGVTPVVSEALVPTSSTGRNTANTAVASSIARAFNTYMYGRLDLGVFETGEWELADSSGALNNAFGEERGRYFGGRLGSMLSPNFGIEARLAYALDDPQTVVVGGLDNDFQVRGWGGVFGRLQTDLGNGLIPYANLGIAGVRGEIDAAPTYELEETVVGLGGAVGVEVNMADNMMLGVDAFMMPQKVRGIGLSIGMNF